MSLLILKIIIKLIKVTIQIIQYLIWQTLIFESSFAQLVLFHKTIKLSVTHAWLFWFGSGIKSVIINGAISLIYMQEFYLKIKKNFVILLDCAIIFSKKLIQWHIWVNRLKTQLLGDAILWQSDQ